MKYIIIHQDLKMAIDGEFRVVPLVGLGQDIWAVHFDSVSGTGTIQYHGRSRNESVDITDFTAFQAYVTEWNDAPTTTPPSIPVNPTVIEDSQVIPVSVNSIPALRDAVNALIVEQNTLKAALRAVGVIA